MAGIKSDMEQQPHDVIVESQEMEKEEEQVKPQKTKRVASLDIFRGLTVAVSLTIFLFLCPSLELWNYNTTWTIIISHRFMREVIGLDS